MKLGFNNDQFQCENGACISISSVNDGDNDCGDRSDEGKCLINIKTACLYYYTMK